jgi:hypothetical protein
VSSLWIEPGHRIFCAAVSCAHAGAFLEPAGEGQIITSAGFSDTTRAFDAKGKLIPCRPTGIRTRQLHRIWRTNSLTIVASPSLDRIQNAPSPGITKTTAAIGDTGIGACAGIYQTPNFVFSVQGVVRTPLDLQTDSANDFYTHSRIWTGEARALLGYSTQIWGYDSFADLETGYRWNDASTPNEWRADLTLGVHATEKILILAQDFAAVSDGRSFQTRAIIGIKAKLAASMLSMPTGPAKSAVS